MNDDLISRDAVLDACSQSINILDAMSWIEDLPSVTPKQRTGHWIIDKGSLDSLYGEICKCSECGGGIIGMSDFCPDCGARMLKPQESEGES